MLKCAVNYKDPDKESVHSMDQKAKLNTTMVGETVTCDFEEKQYEDVVNYFKESTMLIHFLGRPPNEMDLRRWLQEIWCDKGWVMERIKYLGKGYFAVIFDPKVRLKEVLKEGLWRFRGGLVLVQPWEPEFSVDHGAYGRHPAWVELCNLPIHMWQYARSFFETIGKVICFDESQQYAFRPHVRACIMIDMNKELP